MNKNMKAGYQDKPDSMRELADRLMDHPGHAKDVYFSKAAADTDKIRPYKKGGHVKCCDKEMKDTYKKGGCVDKKEMRGKYAEGGAAKLQRGVATLEGKQISHPEGGKEVRVKFPPSGPESQRPRKPKNMKKTSMYY